MVDVSDRLGLPMLAVAQAQKEMTHNEALALADLAIQAVIVEVGPVAVPGAPALGACWIVGAAPTGAWAGHAGAIAGWTSGGWRFVAPFEGMSVWSIADATIARRQGEDWVIGVVSARTVSIGGVQVLGARQPAITNPSGGAAVDTEARATISLVLQAMRTHGLIST